MKYIVIEIDVNIHVHHRMIPLGLSCLGQKVALEHNSPYQQVVAVNTSKLQKRHCSVCLLFPPHSFSLQTVYSYF